MRLFKHCFLFLILFIASCSTGKIIPPSGASITSWTPPVTEYQNQHKHWAYVLDVYDGDSVTLWVENGFNNFQLWKTRFLDIDAPEVRGSERELGLITKKWLADQILGQYIIIDAPNGKLDKYGRLLIRVYEKDDLLFEYSLNQKMVDMGLAEDYVLRKSDLIEIEDLKK